MQTGAADSSKALHDHGQVLSHVVVLALAYFIAGWLGLSVADQPGNVSALWPPSGLGLAALLVWRARVWPGIWIGSLVTNVVFFPGEIGTPRCLLGAALIATGSTIAILVARRAVERFAGGRAALSSPRSVAAFAGSAAAACVISSTVGFASTAAFVGLPFAAAPRFLLTWWFGDTVGMLAVTPIVLSDGVRRERRAIAWIGSIALSLAVSQVVFGRPLDITDGIHLPLTWVVLPPVIWAAMRLGGPGVAVQTLLLHAMVSWATVTGRGPFSVTSAETALLLTDGLLLAVLVTGLVLVAAMAQAARHRADLESERSLLERHVEERTAKLAEANAALTQEIATRVKLGEQLVASQKQEAIGRLAGGVAHDFNNLLTVVSGQAELLAASRGAGPEVQDSANAILTASRRAAELTRKLLAVARRQPNEPRTVDVARALSDARRLVRPILPENITLDVVANGGTVRVDPSQFDQIVLNLCMNARDAMPRGGHLRIEQSVCELGPETAESVGLAQGRWVLVTFTDDGEGIPPDVVGRIFEPFFTTKLPERGTGLGLSTALGIASMAGGTLSVRSESGVQTTFSLWLPEALEPAVHNDLPAVVERAEPPRSGGATILVAEDEPLVRRFVVSALEREGYRVLVGGDGEEALSIARQHQGRLDLVLSDVVMPRIGGPELVAELRRHGATRALFMSGFHEQQVELEHERLLQKPFTLEELLVAVKNALDGEDAHANWNQTSNLTRGAPARAGSVT